MFVHLGAPKAWHYADNVAYMSQVANEAAASLWLNDVTELGLVGRAKNMGRGEVTLTELWSDISFSLNFELDLQLLLEEEVVEQVQ